MRTTRRESDLRVSRGDSVSPEEESAVKSQEVNVRVGKILDPVMMRLYYYCTKRTLTIVTVFPLTASCEALFTKVDVLT